MTPTDPTRPLSASEALRRRLADAIHAAQFRALSPGVFHGEDGWDCDCFAAADAAIATLDAERAALPPAALREAIHRHRDGCNGRPHRRWYRGQNKCDTLAALSPAPTPARLLRLANGALHECPAPAPTPVEPPVDGLDVERLTWALHITAPRNHNLGEGPARAICDSPDSHKPRAKAIAAEYARLAATKAGSS